MELLLSILATFYLTFVVTSLDGPFDIFLRLRSFKPLRSLLTCFWCVSLYFALIFSLVYVDGLYDVLTYTFATAGAASLIYWGINQ